MQAAVHGVTKSWAQLRDFTFTFRRVWQSVLANMPQYSCLETPLPDRESWQATVYRVAKCRTLRKQPCVHRHKTFFACGSTASVRVEPEGGRAIWFVGTLWCQVRRDTDCLCPRSYDPIRVLFRASCSWRSEGLFGQSFSIAPPIQAPRGLPCLGPFSFV